jgi:excinuclease ABC subunit B
MVNFKIQSDFTPKGDQPKAIEKLTRGILSGKKYQVLVGVTGSGKTFTMANIIANVNKPALIIAPNKTLAGQLYDEFRTLFPENAVEYFVSYYDYYQPEAYLPVSDTYIQKDSSINEMIDKLRHSATRSVLSRRDVVVVASVSCIFGLGAPEDYLEMRVLLQVNMNISRDKLLLKLVSIHYERNDVDFHRGVFRVRGDRVEIFPAYENEAAVRIDFFGDEIDGIAEIDPLRGTVVKRVKQAVIYPASHYVTTKTTLNRARKAILEELKERTGYFTKENKLIECQRIEERTNFDLEMMLEVGYCNGIENYSRHLTGRSPGQPPPTLLDYFPDDFLIFIDESHIAVPQLRAMYNGDRSRKTTLVDYGFRLPSALDNRPLKFDEFTSRINQLFFVSATPAEYELEQGNASIAEQIVRPTGLLDPVIEIHDAETQVDDLYKEIQLCIEKKERILVTTLTKRMAEDLADYYSDLGVKVRYLHSDIDTMERMEIIRELRLGSFDVLIGINLLREGLDIPEVSLVGILDADKEGFLRSTRSFIQTAGRASRNTGGRVIMYAQRVTRSMKEAIAETERRRKIQIQYNKLNNIVPETIQKAIKKTFDTGFEPDSMQKTRVAETIAPYNSSGKIDRLIKSLEKEMLHAAKELDFEKAAALRDRIDELKKKGKIRG